jgi:para-nitrobenzyl esterase
MVFVHGGSNAGGWSYEPNYVGGNLAARGVVVVTIAYRVGPFGFFSHPALNQAQGEPIANFGLLDIRAGFQWVNSHIRSFGGDPENITAFGESSGAFNLVDLLLVDLAGGRVGDSLFRRLLSQSIGGPSTIRKTLAEEQATGEFLAQQLGLGPEVTADRLRQVPAGELIRAVSNLPDSHYFSAVIDGSTVPRHPLETLRSARAAGVDLIAGTNADEWYMYLDEGVSRSDLEQSIELRMPENKAALLAEVEQEVDIRKAMDRVTTADDMLCPSRFLASTVTELGGRGWVYYFSRQRPGSEARKLGAYHGAEIPYIFDMHDDWLPTDHVDEALTSTMMDYWVQFARSGNPNLSGRPEWPMYSDKRPRVMELGDHIGAIDAPDLRLCELLGSPSLSSTREQH